MAMNSIIVMVVIIPVIVFAVDYAILRLISETDQRRKETETNSESHDK